MHRLLLATAAFVSACSQVQPISDAEKAEIDCLASITVVEITDAIREGAEAGTDPADLQSIPDEKIAAAIEKLEAKYSGRMDEAYLEYDINHRLDKIQDALNNRDPDSEATQIMNDTLELGRTCTFGS
ncbi:MAG: hypothetical protein ACX94B_06020 [Henriciella sp.]|nr:hypothetical protein [Hyphomonadaceae bacterium]